MAFDLTVLRRELAAIHKGIAALCEKRDAGIGYRGRIEALEAAIAAETARASIYEGLIEEAERGG